MEKRTRINNFRSTFMHFKSKKKKSFGTRRNSRRDKMKCKVHETRNNVRSWNSTFQRSIPFFFRLLLRFHLFLSFSFTLFIYFIFFLIIIYLSLYEAEKEEKNPNTRKKNVLHIVFINTKKKTKKISNKSPQCTMKTKKIYNR